MRTVEANVDRDAAPEADAPGRIPVTAREARATTDRQRPERLLRPAVEAVPVEPVDDDGVEAIALAVVGGVAARHDRQLHGDGAGRSRDRLLDEIAAGQETVQ